jgi:hypothetical protein
MRKMMLYGKKYGGTDPQLIEGDIFRMVISVLEFDQPEHAWLSDTENPLKGMDPVPDVSQARPKSVPSRDFA